MLSASAPPTSNPGSKLGTENPSCRLKNASAFRYIPALPTEKNKSLCDFVSAGDMFDLDNQPCIQSDEFKNHQERKYKIHVFCFLRLEVDLLSRRSALHLDAGRRGLTRHFQTSSIDVVSPLSAFKGQKVQGGVEVGVTRETGVTWAVCLTELFTFLTMILLEVSSCFVCG